MRKYTDKEILSCVDHTLLRVDATFDEIKALIDEAIANGAASVCIPPSFVERGKQYANGKMAICTVIGFPSGYSTKLTKVIETADAAQNGADEIDMVINVGDVKDKNFDAVLDEIKAVRMACEGKILKVIIETCMLTDEEKIKMCEIVSESGADYIKTSTGFGSGGATAHDIELFAKNVKGIKIKAAGGIKSVADAEEFMALGASRLGTSSLIKYLKEESK
ncbi:MAG: deoxyribose-phosphate aldolase [Ruminococcaceae bacterium]|nr:deoxyribose-phosphate aldolase [Oscillospiraceae bacterium]